MVNHASKPAASLRRSTVAVRRHVVLSSRFLANEEPALGDLLDDPMLQRLMASDGITPDALMHVVAQAQQGLRQRLT